MHFNFASKGRVIISLISLSSALQTAVSNNRYRAIRIYLPSTACLFLPYISGNTNLSMPTTKPAIGHPRRACLIVYHSKVGFLPCSALVCHNPSASGSRSICANSASKACLDVISLSISACICGNCTVT